MPSKLTSSIRLLTRRLGFELTQFPPPDFDNFTLHVIKSVKSYTMTSPERIHSVCESINYIAKNRIPGDIVECGVWKGGSMMAIAMTLLKQQDTSRELWLFDTFEGMSAPTKKDISAYGKSAFEMLKKSSKNEQESVGCYSSLDEVKQAVYSIGYPKGKIRFIKGKVEDTIPQSVPQKIALLRLDTDWYESTHHELVHLFPLLSPGGVIIIDDYGYWQGARQATDDYIEKNQIKILLNRIDDTGRIAIKLPS